MSVKPRTYASNKASAYSLLFTLFLVIYPSECDDSLMERLTILRADNDTLPITTTPQGTIQGINMLTRYNRTVFGFLGVPYGQPPIGDLRFKAALPPTPWTGTYNASVEAEPCPYGNVAGQLFGQEDCLYHNLFTPQLPTTDNNITLLPVMVYVLGGGFKTVDSSMVQFGPDFLLDQDVLLIVPNFRVGVLGYLTTGDEVSPGNYGLKDVVRVLEWIQENIESYGGDPTRVTIFGGSSGAISVHLLALSNLTNGLIHNYITQSGSAISDGVNKPLESHVNNTKQLAEHFGCPTSTSTLMVNCLRGINASEIINMDSLFYVWKTWPNNVWFPSAEPDIEGALITENPADLINSGKIRDLPWMSTVNRDDGMTRISIDFYQDTDTFDEFITDIDTILPLLLDYDNKFDNPTAYTNAIKSFYFNDLTANKTLLIDNFTQLIGDSSFVYPTYKAIQKQLEFAQSPQYFGCLQYRGVLSYTYFFSGGSTRFTEEVAHGDELIYLYEAHDNRFGPEDYERTENDWVMVDRMVQLWTSFATNSVPTMNNSIGTAVWEPYSSANNYFRLGNRSEPEFEMKNDLFIERVRFWVELDAAASAGEFDNSLACNINGNSLLFSLTLILGMFYNIY